GKNQVQTVVNKNFGNEDSATKYIQEAIAQSKVNDKALLYNDVLKSVASLTAYNDELLSFQQKVETEIEPFRQEQKRREGVLNRLMGDYVAVKELYQSKNFIPDANSTLRLT